MAERTVTAPAIVLVRPQLGENIGAAARAMLNCGLTDLRLVAPRDGWPSPRARRAATGAVHVVDSARLFATVSEATADLRLVYATTARQRDMLKPTVTPEEAVAELGRSGSRGGFLFGPERTGLDNDEVARAGKVLHIPLDPAFQSLNLAQAVLLVAYEVFRHGSGPPRSRARVREPSRLGRPATQAELDNLFEHLEQELERAEFFRVSEKRPTMVRNLRTVLHRAALRSHEVRTLHGMISALVGRRKDGAPVRRRG